MTTNYNELVDHLVSTMPSNSMTIHSTKERKSFDQLYEEFKSKSVEDQLENLKGLGRELVTRIDRIVDNLNVILEGIEEEESNNKEFEITVDPLTHKVIYNTELNEYKVVRRED